MCDTYKMMTRLVPNKRGVDCDDLFATIVENLELLITQDECFIIFYRLDKDGDGVLNYQEICDAFIPRENEYAVLVNSRGGFYGAETNAKKFFMGETRTLLKKFIRGFIECEVSIELIRQRIMNKIAVKPGAAFAAMDVDNKEYLTLDDFRNFIKSVNMYPIEKNLSLLFERFDRDEDKVVTYDEFVTAITPFLSGIKDF